MEHFLFGRIPFSIGDILYGFLILYSIKWLYTRIKTRFQNPKRWLKNLFCLISGLYFLFHLLWGLNFYRIPLGEQLGINGNYTEEELIKATRYFIDKTNASQLNITQDSSIATSFPYDRKRLTKLSFNSLKNNTVNDVHFNIKYKSLKPSLFSTLLTYMGFSGYLNPLTNEAQFNAKVPPFKIPTLLAHEQAHQLGYAKENEANFIAVLATVNDSDPYFKYSGYSFALQYCLGDLTQKNPEKARELSKEINLGVKENFKEVRQFWEAHENPFEPGFKLFYDSFLKANNQPHGMKSYNEVVGMLVGYYNKDI